MNAKVRVVAICLALSALAGLVLLVVRPSLNPAHVRPLPLIALGWTAFLTAAWLLRKVRVRTAVKHDGDAAGFKPFNGRS